MLFLKDGNFSSIFISIFTMLYTILVVLYLFDKSLSAKLLLFIEENTKPANPIGNIQTMIKNQTNRSSELNFKSFRYNENYESYGTKNLIKVDSKNGDIWLQSPLDREEICQSLNNCEGNTILEYLINVDTTIFELKIEIIDINDNSPSFNPDEKIIEIPEGIAKMTKYALPVAKDKDSYKFGVKRYVLKSISNNDYSKYFELLLNPKTKYPYLTVIDDLDRELKDHFEFYLFAIDGGDNQGRCKITVKITDINDNTPQWIGLPYRQQVRECTTDNKVKKLMASDRDNPSTEGGVIRFTISENSPNSELIIRTFFITDDTLYINNGALRSFGQNNLSVYVLATDGGGRSNETTVEIEIIDCNDHAPFIYVETSMPSVIENDQSKISLTRINVNDKDYGINGNFNCHLNDTSHVTLVPIFTDEPQTNKNRRTIFELQTVGDMGFDREKTPRHSVEIFCNDNGQPIMSSSSTITIYVTDQNDNAPRFEDGFKVFSISEDARIGSEVGRVIATDIDAHPNNIISYSIVGDEDSRNTFSVTNQGQIQLLISLDREKIDKYEFSIFAVDNGSPPMNDSCSIKIVILDVNDCSPEIAKEHTFRIVESFGSKSVVEELGKLSATDKDYGYNGSLTFKLKSTDPPNSPIRVLQDGRVSLYGIIDREKSDKIVAEIQVSDGGNPPQVATTTVTVEILDVNDNKPKFTFPTAQYNNFINVSSDQSVGSILGQLLAVDPDKGDNGTFAFRLLGSESQKKTFNVHESGQIVLNELLKPSRKYENRLSIEVRDRGTPSLSETTNLYIRYLAPKADLLNNRRNNQHNGKPDKRNDLSHQKYGSASWTKVMTLIYFLAAALFVIIVSIGSVSLYFWCRGQWFCPMEDADKHASPRELNSSGYQKNNTKDDRNHSMKAALEINNQFLTTRKDNSYQIVDPQGQVINYSSLMKTYGGSPIDQPYQVRSTIHTGGSYSAFHPKSNSPVNDYDHQELSPFNNDEIWEQSQPMNIIDNRTLTANPEVIYDSHKYNVTIPCNFDNSHFTTPSQSRRSDMILLKNDPTYKPKINYVASSFV